MIKQYTIYEARAVSDNEMGIKVGRHVKWEHPNGMEKKWRRLNIEIKTYPALLLIPCYKMPQ